MSRELGNNGEENRKRSARKIGEDPAQNAPETENGAIREDAAGESAAVPEEAPAVYAVPDGAGEE
ncbi:hypothetical protein, partial [Christensenella minuta]|uniref:hypothetical protein n=1 Tax=Christensenella minuta TaxID=626937 RepID=UPI002A835941